MDPTNMNTNMNKDGEIDQWLDTALRQYAKAEPRAGLEARVLANLCAEHTLIARRTRWWWAFGTATAFAAIVVGIWIGQGNRQKTATQTAGLPTAPREEIPRENMQAPEKHTMIATEPSVKAVQTFTSRTAKRPSRSPRANKPLPSLASTSAPKLEQFPSLRPLTEQEQILMSYVANYPESAVLIAQARADALQRDRAQEAAAAAQDTGQ
jgi:hypothetical protein